ncbi:MAG: Ig-like domain-containing protein [Gemmatimonadota bacterium]
MTNSRLLFVLGAAAATLIGCTAGERSTPTPQVATITVTPATPSIIVANTVQLTATALDANATVVTGVTFSWGTNNVGIATVDQSGLVTAIAPGSATITASAAGQSGSATVTVTSGGGGGGPVASISVQPPTASLSVGGTQLLAATPLDAQGQLVTTTVTWTASNTKATVVVNPNNSNAATVTGSTVGVDTITASAGGHSATSIVTITAVPIGTITLSPSGQTLDAAGATVQLSALVKDSLGATLTGVPLTWTSSNTAIARVDSLGFLTTALVAGNVDITATAGGKSGTASFSVVFRWREISTSNGQTSDTPGHTCGITVLKVAYCWGFNGFGQGGIGSNVTWNGPQAVIGNIAFTSIATGVTHTCGINDQGAAYCWGANGSGQLGTGNNNQALIPTPVTGALIFDTTSITAGRDHSCALTTTGLAYCWGANASGQLGNASNSPSSAPAAVSGGLTFTSISAGTFHTCGVATGGAAYCWGLNADHQLGDGTTSPQNVPVAVTGGLSFASIAAGGGHTCGIATTGNIFCWGLNTDGQLGVAAADTFRVAPTQIFGGQVYSAVDAGAQSTCAILAGGGTGPSGKCWGGNLGYQIGNGDTVSVATYVVPTAISAPTASRISTGSRHACIVTTSKLAYCWGRNAEGQMGIGIFSPSPPNIAVPTKVIGQP